MVRETGAPSVATGCRRLSVVVKAASVLVVLWLFFTPATAEATAYTVTKLADTNDGTCGGDCSLREAITAANANAAAPHTITFSISSGCIGQCIITVSSALPTIARSMSLDGTTAPLGRISLTTNGATVSKGLTINADNVTVRGFGIYGFDGDGIFISHGDGCVIAGNIIGLDQSDILHPNSSTGIHIDNSIGTRIGGTVAADRNVIAGSPDGIFLNFGTVTGTVIQGNYIGTNTNGLTARPNLRSGIFVSGSLSTTIGGATAVERNVIAGNGGSGLDGQGILVSGAQDTQILGNYIGLSADGSALGNLGEGIFITGSGSFVASDTTVGGTTSGAANTIANNGKAGIRVDNVSQAGGGHQFLRNTIYNNGGLGIDIGPLGVTPNDSGDGDTGPNGLQNFPSIVSVGVGGGNTVIAGALNSRPSRGYGVYFFSQADCDPSGNGEGLVFLTSTSFTTDAAGSFNFNVAFPNALSVGTKVTALAIDSLTHDTSEFSACASAQGTGIVVTPTSGLQTTEAGGQATFTIRLVTLPSSQVSVPISSSDTSEGTVSPPHVTFTTLNARIPQTVTITGVPDGVGDGNVTYSIVLGASISSDPGYSGMNPPDPTVTNRDIDVICSPRPRVAVTTAPESAGRLRITLSATGTNNTLSQVHVISTPNSEVESAGQARTGDFVLPLGNVVSTSFVVHRLQPGQAATVRAIVTDGCGGWTTFFGGGVNGFP